MSPAFHPIVLVVFSFFFSSFVSCRSLTSQCSTSLHLSAGDCHGEQAKPVPCEMWAVGGGGRHKVSPYEVEKANPVYQKTKKGKTGFNWATAVSKKRVLHCPVAETGCFSSSTPRILSTKFHGRFRCLVLDSRWMSRASARGVFSNTVGRKPERQSQLIIHIRWSLRYVCMVSSYRLHGVPCN